MQPPTGKDRPALQPPTLTLTTDTGHNARAAVDTIAPTLGKATLDAIETAYDQAGGPLPETTVHHVAGRAALDALYAVACTLPADEPAQVAQEDPYAGIPPTVRVAVATFAATLSLTLLVLVSAGLLS